MEGAFGMIEFFVGTSEFGGALLVAYGVVRYFFKVTPRVLTPSYLFMGLYVLSFVLDPLTAGRHGGSLSLLWNIITAVVVIASLTLCYFQRVPLVAFLVSLLFQLPFCLYVWYHAGLGFTHKFG
jgi:hypothetical protein